MTTATTTTRHTSEAILAAPKTKGMQMIKDNLAISNKWVMAAILAIYARQTADEQQSESTEHHNGVGFSGADAEILSSFAKQILDFNAGRSRFRTALSENQMGLARRRITKYSRQLLEIAQAKATAEAKAVTPEWATAEFAFDEYKAEMRACGMD